MAAGGVADLSGRRWLKISEAARYLNFSTVTVERMLAAGELTRHHVRRRVLLDREEIDRVVLASAPARGA